MLLYLIRPIGYIVGYLLRIVLLTSFRGMRYERLVIGTCTIRGPHSFVELCRASLYELKRIDESMFHKITNLSRNRRITFYFHKLPFDDGFNGLYSIPPQFCVWSINGVIARIVYAITKEEKIGGEIFAEHVRNSKAHKNINETVRNWLIAHSFQKELVAVYELN